MALGSVMCEMSRSAARRATGRRPGRRAPRLPGARRGSMYVCGEGRTAPPRPSKRGGRSGNDPQHHGRSGGAVRLRWPSNPAWSAALPLSPWRHHRCKRACAARGGTAVKGPPVHQCAGCDMRDEKRGGRAARRGRVATPAPSHEGRSKGCGSSPNQPRQPKSYPQPNHPAQRVRACAARRWCDGRPRQRPSAMNAGMRVRAAAQPREQRSRTATRRAPR